MALSCNRRTTWGVAPVEKKRPVPPKEVGAGLFLNG
jgi:hypothetical protein